MKITAATRLSPCSRLLLETWTSEDAPDEELPSTSRTLSDRKALGTWWGPRPVLKA